MKVVCIDNSWLSGELSSGKIYSAKDISNYDGQGNFDEYESSFAVYVKNDFGKYSWYKTYRFKSLSDVREEKLNRIITLKTKNI